MDMPDHVEFTVNKPDQVIFQTRTNGDTLVVNSMVLDREAAATVGWLANSPNKLKVEITELDEPLDEPD